MNETKEACKVCGTVYDSYKNEIVDDSHFTYTEYFRCPQCGYTEKLEGEIEKIFAEKTRATAVIGGILEVNTEELSKFILKVVRKHWPRPRKARMAKV